MNMPWQGEMQDKCVGVANSWNIPILINEKYIFFIIFSWSRPPLIQQNRDIACFLWQTWKLISNGIQTISQIPTTYTKLQSDFILVTTLNAPRCGH